MSPSVFIKVERSFYIVGKPAKAGEIIEVGAAFAKELVSANKASIVEAPARPVRAQPEPEVKTPVFNESKAAKPPKEKGNAQ